MYWCYWRQIYTIWTCFLHFQIKWGNLAQLLREILCKFWLIFSNNLRFTHSLDNYHFIFGMVEVAWTKNLMMKSWMSDFNFFPLVTSQTPNEACKVPQNMSKWQKKAKNLSNALNIVWTSLPGQKIEYLHQIYKIIIFEAR